MYDRSRKIMDESGTIEERPPTSSLNLDDLAERAAVNYPGLVSWRRMTFILLAEEVGNGGTLNLDLMGTCWWCCCSFRRCFADECSCRIDRILSFIHEFGSWWVRYCA